MSAIGTVFEARARRLRGAGALAAAVLVLSGLWASSAQAEFGVKSFDVQIAANPPAVPNETTTSTAAGTFTQAGGHPYAIVTHIEWNSHPDPTTDEQFAGLPTPDGDIKDTDVDLPVGLVGNPTVIPQCTAQQLIGPGIGISDQPECPTDSVVGVIHLQLNITETAAFPVTTTFPLYNMTPPSGLAARFGFNVAGNLIYLDASLQRRGAEYVITIGPHDAPQALRVVGSDVTFWGVPADPSHDAQRCDFGGLGIEGTATNAVCPTGIPPQPPLHDPSEGPHPSGVPAVPLLRMPTSCTPTGVGVPWALRTDSWEEPGLFSEASLLSHLAPYAPDPSAPGPEEGITGCNKVPFTPDLAVTPSQQSAGSASGLRVFLSFPSDGILNPTGIAQSDIKKAVVTLPEGMTINPSEAEGLGVCTPSQYAQESLTAAPEEGCPPSSKIGTVAVRTPLLEDPLEGAVYIAQPDDPRTASKGAENPFDSLIALYIVIKSPQAGILVKVAGKVEPDPSTGQLITTFDDLPQLPFESFTFKFREGPRAPLITPPACGTYTTEGLFTPWANPEEAVPTSSSFQITSGVNGGPCPPAGVPPFQPGFIAGSLNNNAASYSPFYMRLTRSDGEQDMTKFSSLLPPGVLAKLAGVSQCPDQAIAAAKAKTGIEEREAPSCPANSQIGRILAGAGVGSVLVYVPGKVYLAGPYQGAPLSVAVITPAVAGPFDVGTIVTREALSLDPETGEVHVDGERSDPIPHILAGIPLDVRDIRVYVDRPDFTVNPTSCDRFQVGASLYGSYLDPLSPADDVPVALSVPYQAANCLNLGFGPKLSIKLKGATRRGGHPALTAVLKARPGDANIAAAQVALPHSEFLDQAHIRTVCTRVQFASGGGNGEGCPAGAVYGKAKAWSPLLDEPLSGPVFLRSSSHKLPDLVAALHGIVNIDLDGRIDSVNGGIRSSFESVPDAPVTEFTLSMQGGKKGLLQNSTNLCQGTHRAQANLSAQNGKMADFNPVVRSDCGKGGKKGKRHRRHAKKHRGRR